MPADDINVAKDHLRALIRAAELTNSSTAGGHPAAAVPLVFQALGVLSTLETLGACSEQELQAFRAQLDDAGLKSSAHSVTRYFSTDSSATGGSAERYIETVEREIEIPATGEGKIVSLEKWSASLALHYFVPLVGFRPSGDRGRLPHRWTWKVSDAAGTEYSVQNIAVPFNGLWRGTVRISPGPDPSMTGLTIAIAELAVDHLLIPL